MTSANGYDQDLLAAAPKPTKEERQEGYNVNLLGEERTATVPLAHSTDLEHGTKEEYPISKPAIPFYRTRKGKIIIGVIIVLVVIAAAVGGGVGGTRKSKTPTFNTSTQGTGGQAGQASGKPTTTPANGVGQDQPAATAGTAGGSSAPIAPSPSNPLSALVPTISAAAPSATPAAGTQPEG